MNWEFGFLDFIADKVQNDSFSSFLRWITYLGDGTLIWIFIGLFLLIFKKTRFCGLTVLISLLVFAVFNNYILKDIIKRERPFIQNPIYLPKVEGWFFEQGSSIFVIGEIPDDYSFMSGHTVGCFLAITIFTLSLKKIITKDTNRVWKIIGYSFYTLSIVLAILISFSRVYFLVHFPTDVICGALYGIMGGVITYFIASYFRSSIVLNRR